MFLSAFVFLLAAANYAAARRARREAARLRALALAELLTIVLADPAPRPTGHRPAPVPVGQETITRAWCEGRPPWESAQFPAITDAAPVLDELAETIHWPGGHRCKHCHLAIERNPNPTGYAWRHVGSGPACYLSGSGTLFPAIAEPAELADDPANPPPVPQPLGVPADTLDEIVAANRRMLGLDDDDQAAAAGFIEVSA